VFNNQYADANTWLCKGYDAYGGFTVGFDSSVYQDANLTPIDSIQLTPNSNNIMKSGCQGGAVEKLS
jgi:hypothetical protein